MKMNIHLLPKNPRIILMANGLVGLEIARYLRKRRENIIGLVLHPASNSAFMEEIKEEVGTNNVFSAEQIKESIYLEKIKKLNPDIAICAWYGYILNQDFIEIFPSGCLNMHNSYLPYNRGKYPHCWAIFDNSKYGVTIHYIDKYIDRGNIIAQKEIIIKNTYIAEDLYKKSLEEIIILFKKIWPKIKNNNITSREQEKTKTFRLAQEIQVLDLIDLNKKYKAENLINQIRARSFSDRSYAYFIDKKTNKKIYIKILLSEKHNF